MIKTILIVFALVLFSHASLHRLPNGSPLYIWNTTEQLGIGTYYTHPNLAEIPDQVGPAKWIISPSQQAYFLNITTSGIQWTFENLTYTVISGTCYVSNGLGTYASLVSAYTNAAKIGEDGIYDIYMGVVNDWGYCGFGLSVIAYINSFDNTLYYYAYTQFAPLPAAYLGLGITATGAIDTPVTFIGRIFTDIPPLPAICLALNVSSPSAQWCNNYFLPCGGFGMPGCS